MIQLFILTMEKKMDFFLVLSNHLELVLYLTNSKIMIKIYPRGNENNKPKTIGVLNKKIIYSIQEKYYFKMNHRKR
jgi:hypothetical protein